MKKNNLKFKINSCFLALILVSFCVSGKASAAEIFFEPQEINSATNHIEKVEIFLQTSDNEDVNAFEINIEYPFEFLKLKEWSNGNSIINLWIKEPKNNNGIFSFQGIIPGGYNDNEKGLLMTLYFESRKEGIAKIKIKNDSQILLNDSLGTPAKKSLSLAIINVKTPEKKEPPKDKPSLDFTENIPPEPFAPIISRANEMYGGNYFLIFSTQDKNSGINYYEISEGEDPFRIAQSPYLLRNQRLDEDIRIRAVDKAGNERMEIVPAKQAKKIEKQKTVELELILFTMLLLIILVFFAKYLYNKVKKIKQT
ncbi:MAG: hypothetical protein U9N04_03830 [Patescibacteria group bacterium]|nr:hypothetical protein [Patescibacteria group bacterium]